MTTVDEAIAVLNEIHQADPTVLPALVKHRVPCNKALGDHPTVQVGPREGADKDDCSAYNSGFEATCARVEGHTGDHISCVGDRHHIASWPGRKAA